MASGYVRASSQLWSGSVRNAPAMDWRAAGEAPQPEVDAYFAGLEALREEATRLGGTG